MDPTINRSDIVWTKSINTPADLVEFVNYLFNELNTDVLRSQEIKVIADLIGIESNKLKSAHVIGAEIGKTCQFTSVHYREPITNRHRQGWMKWVL